MVERAEE